MKIEDEDVADSFRLFGDDDDDEMKVYLVHIEKLNQGRIY
ncbi:MAG: hypothetical protein CM15mV80_400 [uncultured marine virus]|nr:MAG: hypothetical protein CM15mV80_400 [uncultured marine virus]